MFFLIYTCLELLPLNGLIILGLKKNIEDAVNTLLNGSKNTIKTEKGQQKTGKEKNKTPQQQSKMVKRYIYEYIYKVTFFPKKKHHIKGS